MFEKLLANLPYHPALIQQMAFYGRRMRQEASIRRLGLVFVVLTFMIQFLAVLSPAQPTLAQSNNDLINGGISAPSQAVAACQQNIGNYGDILNYYGISCSDVAKAATVSLRSTDYGRQLYSVGRLPYGKAGETPATINGQTYYWRYLWSWDTYSYSTYKALEGKSSVTGRAFFILFNCGNLVFVGLPTPPQHCQWNNNILAGDSRCQPPRCSLNASLPANSPDCKSCIYDSGILRGSPLCVGCPYPGAGTILRSSPACHAPCPYNASLPAASPQCKPCAAAQSSSNLAACLQLSKSAANITQGISDANNTTAHAGDTIVYTLYAKNAGRVTVPRFIIQEDLSDVLDYADIVDLHGGSIDPATDMVSWPAQDIPSGRTATEQITVRVKDPIPQTPPSSSDPGHFDMTMTNVYGNTVNIHLPPTVVQASIQTVQALPNTGPGTSLIIGFTITLLAGYFFARSRLLARETSIIVHENARGGA